jgi:hypothetical protein
MTNDNQKLCKIIELQMSAFHLLVIHGNVCLGLRHPKNTGLNRKLAIEFINYAEAKLKEAGIINDKDIKRIHKLERKESPHGF